MTTLKQSQHDTKPQQHKDRMLLSVTKFQHRELSNSTNQSTATTEFTDRGVSPALNTMQGGNRQPKVLVQPCLTPNRPDKRQNGRRFKGDGEDSFTLTSQDVHGVMICQE